MPLPAGKTITAVDLNADVGEGFGVWRLGDDEAMLDTVTTVNVACGFHAGDPSIMRRLCQEAAERGVAVGAHVGYRDLAGFGRRKIEMPPSLVADETIYQIAALDGFAKAAGTRLSHVKPHGALNESTATDAAQASALVQAVAEYDRTLAVLVQPGSELERQARENGLVTAVEAFTDRAYYSNGTLVSRHTKGAVIDDADVVAERAVRMVRDHVVHTTDGHSLIIAPDSLCVHGDTPGAVKIARRVRIALLDSGCELRPFGRTFAAPSDPAVTAPLAARETGR